MNERIEWLYAHSKSLEYFLYYVNKRKSEYFLEWVEANNLTMLFAPMQDMDTKISRLLNQANISRPINS